MKKHLLNVVALAAMSLAPSVTVSAQSQYAPSASNEIYNFDFMGKEEAMLKLFKRALDEGRMYPTKEEFESAGIHMADLEFVRSHVRPRPILSRADRVVPNTYEKRNLWLNLPAGAGKTSDTGFPSGNFSSDVFSMWNYTNLFGSWNHPIFSAPGAWVDAAHRNGTDIFSGIKFFDTTGGRGQGAGSYVNLITQKNEDGSFKYVEPLLNILMYFGSDGVNYNFEASGYSDPEVVAFHQELYKKAKEKGFNNFHIGMYTGNSTLSGYNAPSIFGDSRGRTAETMLNYDGEYAASNSVRVAKQAMNTSDGLYQGFWIVSMNRYWQYLAKGEAKEIGICLWGEHSDSRFWSFNNGKDAYDTQMNYQKLLERGMSGGNRNPIDRPALRTSGHEWEGDPARGGKLTTFFGMAEFIPERSAIQGNLPFATNFCLGNGDGYYFKGIKTVGGWYNMSAQDVVPTYRWLVVNQGTMEANRNLSATFSHYDAYIGGSCLELESQNGANADLILYKTKLNVSAANPYAVVSLKTAVPGNTDSHLKVLLRVAGQWVTADVPNLKGQTWEEFKIPLTGVTQGAEIDRIGLRVDNAPAGYKMYVGHLETNDDIQTPTAMIDNFNVEVKKETTKSMALKLNWDLLSNKVGDRSNYGLLYNDEANVDHFEILYKDGENGKVREIGRTSQWATFIDNIVFASDTEHPYVGVRAVSTDLKSYGPVKWVEVSRANADQLPQLEEIDTYGKSEVDPSANGLDIARQIRYLETVKTTGADENLDFHRSEAVGGNQYLRVTGQTLKVKQGQHINLFFKAHDSHDGLQYCVMKGWLDLDGSGTFGPNSITEDPEEGECLFQAGTSRKATAAFQNPGYNVEFTVPANAHVGKSRMRMVFTDAWFTGTLMPTGLTSKGFSIDFDVEISGDPTNQRQPKDYHDKGEVVEPAGLDVTAGVTTVQGEGVSTVKAVDGTLYFNHVEKAWVYNVDGQLVNTIMNPTIVSMTGMTPGVYVVKMFNKNVIRSQKVVLK